MAEKTEHLILGILAHVDAGKTTMAESMLYHSGTIKKPGRVDHKNAFLDTFEMERSRGITIFSKQALEGTSIYIAGYARTCGLLGRDGEDASDIRLCNPGDQRTRWGAGA